MNHYFDIESGDIILLRPKSSWWMTRYATPLFKHFPEMWTTWNGCIYYPDRYDALINALSQDKLPGSVKQVLTHEMYHVRQQKKYGKVNGEKQKQKVLLKDTNVGIAVADSVKRQCYQLILTIMKDVKYAQTRQRLRKT